MTRFGIYKIIRRYTARVVKKGSDGQSRPISPHVWRHTTAVHLLEAGVEVNVIRAWLGHVSLETTNRYAEIRLLSGSSRPLWKSALHRASQKRGFRGNLFGRLTPPC